MLRFFSHLILLSLIMSATDSQPLTLPPLPYAYNALEPVISEATMRAHHLSHHQTYTEKTNAVLTELRADPATKHLSKLGLDHIIAHIHNRTLPLNDQQRTALRNHGGGYVNHIHFFESLAPVSGGHQAIEAVPDLLPSEGSEVARLVEQSFGSFEQFKAAFTTAALAVFGSGWVWLTYSPQLSSLSVQVTQQQDSPWMEEAWVEAGGEVLLSLDGRASHSLRTAHLEHLPGDSSGLGGQ